MYQYIVIVTGLEHILMGCKRKLGLFPFLLPALVYHSDPEWQTFFVDIVGGEPKIKHKIAQYRLLGICCLSFLTKTLSDIV